MTLGSNPTIIDLIPNIRNLNKYRKEKSIMRGRELSALGAEAKKKQGAETAEFVFEILKMNPYGLSIYEISHELGQLPRKDRKRIIEPGTLHSALDRLLRDGRIEVRESLKEGRLVKLVCPRGIYREELVPGHFKIEKDKLKRWKFKDTLIVYSLNHDTIVVSETEIPDLKKRKFMEPVFPKYTNNSLLFRLPDDVIEFYELGDNVTEVSTGGSNIVIKVRPTGARVTEKNVIRSMLRNETALIVDDQYEFLNNLRNEIKAHFKQVFIAASVSQANKIIEKKRPSILLIDWYFSETPSGQQILEYAKKFKPKAAIVITGKPHGREDIRQFIEAGALWCYDKDIYNLATKMLSRISRRLMT